MNWNDISIIVFGRVERLQIIRIVHIFVVFDHLLYKVMGLTNCVNADLLTNEGSVFANLGGHKLLKEKFGY